MTTYSLKIELGNNNEREITATLTINGDTHYDSVEYKKFSGPEVSEINTFINSIISLGKRFGGLSKIIVQKL